MATLMEKDVLLELVSGAIAKTKETSKENKQYKETLKNIREELYITSCKEIDFNHFVATIDNIKSLCSIENEFNAKAN